MRYCNLHALTISEIYADDRVSGTITIDRRPEASRAMRDARNGSFLESTVWADIEKFLRDPGVVIEQLQQRIAAERNDSKPAKDRLTKLQGCLESAPLLCAK